MAVTFPLFPDDMTFPPDNRVLMNNQQIITNSPSRAEEESLTRFSNFVERATIPSKLPQSQRTSYTSVKRPLGSQMEPVNTSERSHRRTAVEESKERAKRAAVLPRRPKGYVYPTDRVRPTLHSKLEERPKINQERYEEYKQRKAINVSDRVNYTGNPEDRNTQGDLFSREATDYFKQKRESLFDRGI